MYISNNSTITFEECSTIALNNNDADKYDGGLRITNYSTVTFKENSKVTINNNSSEDGGAVNVSIF